MNFTAAQTEAIAARGNVLVVAGAGTGKTRTLVERCLDCLINDTPRASLDEILMVTFTEAAAAEMRQRIRERLEEELERQPEDPHWPEQLALFETAHIGTLHSFCFQLVRQHFYQLELDPQLSVLAEEEALLLAEETLDTLLQRHYAGRGRAAQAVQALIQTQGRGWDKPIRSLVLRLHHYAQTLPNPDGWIGDQLALFATAQPLAWREWLRAALADWPHQWLETLRSISASNEVAAQVAAALTQVLPDATDAAHSEAFQAIILAGQNCPKGKKTVWLKPLQEFFGEATFLASLVCAVPGTDPLAEDWTWVRGQMATLIDLAREFSHAFTEDKRELGVVDFQDLEQYSLTLLWDHHSNQPTTIARHWQKKLRFLFVDEYQDINAAQDKILQALSRDGNQANRFLVGDVKQSIYRFRLANPQIFQGYTEQWGSGQGNRIALVDNFRSREGLLHFVNSFFGLLMQRDLGGVDYHPAASLRFGAHEDRAALSVAANPAPCVELHLRSKSGMETPELEDEKSPAFADLMDLEQADKEARLVTLRLNQLKATQHPVWDAQTRQFRPVDWRDMAILLRSPAKKAESYAKEFARLNLPLQVARGGFYRSLEVSDMLSLLQLLDNPLQDLPALAVLHSPLVGLTPNELAVIRLSLIKGHFWTALTRWHQSPSPKANPRAANAASQTSKTPPANGSKGPDVGSADGGTRRKVGAFLDRYARWRRLARQVSLSRCLETVLAETHYASWLLTQPCGEQRHANLQRLVFLAQEFDQFQRQGLFRFLKFIEAQQLAETEPEVAAAPAENAVRLMSIHQSKGLEFPVVVVADLGKPFNLVDLRGEIILDEEYGLCPQIKPPSTGKRYPSLAYWLARRRQTRELLGEELRLLYVAMTRARDTLILSASLPERKLNALWTPPGPLSAAARFAVRSYSDWLGTWFSRNVSRQNETDLHGKNSLVRWFIHDDASLLAPAPGSPEPNLPESSPSAPLSLDDLRQRLAWQYPFAAATSQPAKTSVSLLRRRAAAADADEAAALFEPELDRSSSKARNPQPEARSSPGSFPGGLTAADIGSAHHQFLQLISLEQTGSLEALLEEGRRLEREGRLASEQLAALDFKALSHFWKSDLGARVRAQMPFVRRELAFTARFSPADVSRFVIQPHDPTLDGEFVIVQGVVDLAVIAPEQIWLLDFKTDRVEPGELSARAKAYEPQLKLYAKALSLVYRRPFSECYLYFLHLQRAVPVNPD